jgi:probable rRNA maturation factor
MQDDELTVDIMNRQTRLPIDDAVWIDRLQQLFRAEGVVRGEISVAVVDDPKMHELNRQYLDHDYPTDVLSFVLDQQPNWLLGEIIVSADTAMECCEDFDWPASHEFGLYVIHGALHLVGYDDKQPEKERRMRQRELHYLRLFGMQPPESDAAREHFGAELLGGAASS